MLFRSQVAELIDTGCDAMGAPLGLCSEAFRERFAAAPLIIAKGQANYETLSNVDAPICFLLQAKCEVTANRVLTAAAPPRTLTKAVQRIGPQWPQLRSLTNARIASGGSGRAIR